MLTLKFHTVTPVAPPHPLEMGDGLEDFAGSMLVDENVAEELRAKKLHALRRGKIITDDELAVDEEEEEAEAGDEEAEVEADDEEAEGGAAGAAATVRREVKWSLPEGLVAR